MQIINAVVFRSIPENYEKEKSGAKPNTVRKITLDSIGEIGAVKPTHIIVENTLTSDLFIRKLTDVTQWKEITIFSWNPNEGI